MSARSATALNPDRVERLRGYLAGLAASPGLAAEGQALFRAHQQDLEAVTPLELMELFNGQLQSGQTPEQIFQYLDKVINAVGHALHDQPLPPPEPGTLLHLLTAENQALEARLGAIRSQLLNWTGTLATHQAELAAAVSDLTDLSRHYEKIQNIVFPMLEKRQARFHGLALLWALQDHARQTIKEMTAQLHQPDVTDALIRQGLGRLFFALQGLVNKEQWILFPIAAELFSAQEQAELLAQAREYEPAFLSPAQYQAYFSGQNGKTLTSDSRLPEADLPEFPLATSFSGREPHLLQTPTGHLTASQAEAIFNALPVDLSFVDANNKVAFFTRPKDRIFPRSPAVIGRDVDRCHPPASVHVVEKIIAEFKAGRRDTARFWIDLKGRKVLIEYFAVRDEMGDYLGVLEVSQDITEIQQLDGQQRLLDWI
ncbi:MAG: DUF438 domain-containing protein [Clostridia bacterium]|nr:DUF438 domain-containing protein [Clostridia bacterium]NCC77082.1 DUF438 domain-containing protein [Clostridia bacterium]